jgi:hypothetical protein
MAEFKDYVWLFPFIGAILIGISLITPAAFQSTPFGFIFIWMNGFALLTGGGYGPETDFLDIPGYYIPGIIATIFLIICTLILFVSSLTHRKKETPGSWIALSILLIGGTIYFIASVEIGVAIYNFNQYDATEWVSFWGDYRVGFAVIAPFIGGGLTLLGAILGKTIGKQEFIGKIKAVPQVKESVPVVETSAPTATSSIKEAKVVRYCPECGTKIEQIGSAFCSVCGFKF